MSDQPPYTPPPPIGSPPPEEPRDRPPRRGIDLTSLRIPMLMWGGLILLAVLVLFFAIRPRGEETAELPLAPTATQIDFSQPVPTFTPGPTSTPPPGDEPPPEPTEPAAPTGVLAVGQPARVGGTGGSGVNFRSGPGLGFAAVGVLADDTSLTIIGGPEEADGFTWWQARLEDGSEGWAVQDFLSP